MVKYKSRKLCDNLCNTGSAKWDWENIYRTLKPVFRHNADNQELLVVQCYVLISHYVYTSITPLVFRWTFLQSVRNQIFWQDITSVCMRGSTKIQCWWRRCLVDINFCNTLFYYFICIFETFTWCPH